MKRLLAVGLPAMVLVLALPFVAALVVMMTTSAAAQCLRPRDQSTAQVDQVISTAPTSTGNLADPMPSLMRLRLAANYPTLTAEQARNAITIARVARDVGVPRYGLQIAIATAIQESKLINLSNPGSGDHDSLGLFQQRPSQGWGTPAQITDPVLATRAFFGRAAQITNRGLLDVLGWTKLSLTDAAQAVQHSGHPTAYARWAKVAGGITDLLGTSLPGTDLPAQQIDPAGGCDAGGGAFTVATLNILGAGHTSGGWDPRPGYAGWAVRLPGAIRAIETSGATIAALQEVHPPQAAALEREHSQQWGMFPVGGRTQNKVFWSREVWQLTGSRMITIPYFHGAPVQVPAARLSLTTASASAASAGSTIWAVGTGAASAGQSVWVVSVHNPADSFGSAHRFRAAALVAEAVALRTLAADGTPVVIAGDFNDGKDGDGRAHCALTPQLTNAFGGTADPCRPSKGDGYIDHVFGGNLTWAAARVDHSVEQAKYTDHPLVVATTVGDDPGCAVDVDRYHLGPVKPELARLVGILAPMFDITTVGGYRADARDPAGHPSGRAADFMVGLTAAGRAKGDRLAAYAQAHAQTLGVDYIIWQQRIWSVARAREGWRIMSDRGSATENHRDHVHINARPATTSAATSSTGSAGSDCEKVVYPVPARYVGSDRHNWHQAGSHWGSWHTGTDFSIRCGTPVYAAHAGTIAIDTTQSWAGPRLVKVSQGAGALTTWYAHMEAVTVTRGAHVEPGQQIGLAGAEGNTTGCHLHLEVHLKGGAIYGSDNVNPSTWLAEHAAKQQSAV